MGKKMTEFSPVSVEEMDFQEEPSIPEVKRFQGPSSWAPMTPDKLNPPKQHPIYADKRENQLGEGNWFPPERFSPGFPHETQLHGLEPCSDPSNSREGNFENLAWNSQDVAGIDDLSLDSFKSLIALADAAARTIFSNPFESNFTAPPLANQDFSFAPNLWNNSSCAPDTYLYGDPHPSQRTYDLNSPPSAFTDEFLSQNISTPYAPITPDQSKKAENRLAHRVLPSSMDEEAHQENNRQVNEAATTRVELNHDKVQQQLTTDSSSTTVSTELQENHNLDRRSNTSIDLNMTPQQKPRRKKHRPKVVVEGKPKRTPPKPPAGPKESTTGKRKYVRKNRLDNSPVTPTAELTGRTTDPKTAPPPTEKSARRSLNFDFEPSQGREESSTCRPNGNENAESQAQNFCTRLGQAMEENVEKTQVDVAYRLTRSMSKILEEYLSLPTAAKTDPPLEKINDDAQKESARGKCQIIFSNETHDKQAITIPSAPRSPNNSNCSSSSPCLREEDRARGLKRGLSCTTNEPESIRTNMIGGHYSSLHEFAAVFPANACNNHRTPGMLFPAIYKKKRTEKGHCTPTSCTSPTSGANSRFAAAQFNLSSISTKNTSFIDAQGNNNTSSISTKSPSCIDAQGKQQVSQCKLALDLNGRMTKKRSKGPTKVRDFASLIGIIGCNQFPTFPAQGAPLTGDMQTHTTSHNPYTCMEALVAHCHATATKKRTKRNYFATDATQKRLPTMDTMDEYLRGLDINRESIPVAYQEQGFNFRYEGQRAVVPYNFRYAENDALVLYQKDGTVVPFDGTFNPVRRRKPRPKVDLDDETNKVWKLLLESINSEGIDGTDEEKAKWWEEERRVYRGRADSFIARMHLVQGDRRFSPWKGSVVDSVIGVFLTQNVSDHLSSSAFMSLAARFPPKSESNDTPCFEETSTCVNEPEVCILDLEDTEENCVSEQSGATEESVNQASVQNNMSASFQEQQKSPSEDNHACSSLEEEFYKAFPLHNIPVGNPKDNIQSQAQEKNHRTHQALEAQNLSRDTLDITDSTSIIDNPKSSVHFAVESRLKDHEYLPGKAITAMSSDPSRVTRERIGKKIKNSVEWDSLRLQAQAKGKREKTSNTMDSMDYEAVRCADVDEIADAIRERGMNNMLAERMKDFLRRLVREHGSIDLEWLRDVPPDKAKEYLLSFKGLGLKSVECVRLLTLHHLAFPVDTNVGRIAVRLGWVPLQPLPESLQLHLLELYPVLESIQRYLWPRLCKLDQRTLYELHYQMITFGKVFCTKSKPNCNACPMRGECRHFASAFASARLALPGPEGKSIVAASKGVGANQHPVDGIKPLQLPLLQANEQLQAQYHINHYEPIVEVPTTPEPTVEMPESPAPDLPDIEDLFYEDPEEIPTIKLNIEELTQNLKNYMQQNMELQEGEMSKALVALTPEAASLPMPKLKNVSRLRTEHRVYELPDSHPLLEGLDKREPDDPCSYLLAIWTPGETPNSIQPPERNCSSQEFGNLCCEETCFSCSSIREANSQTVRGTLLIPCRTAMRGSFPLNGTYFQVNEVFADHESSINPIDVPRAWLWNLPRRTVFFGTSIPTIFRGLSTESIQFCFRRGFVCVRGFDQMTRGPRPLLARLHLPASKLAKAKGKTYDGKNNATPD